MSRLLPPLICLLGLLCSSVGVSAETVSEGVRAFISRERPGALVEETVTGELGGNGISMTALLLGNSHDNAKQILVVRESPNGVPKLFAASKQFQNCQHGTELSIAKLSLFVSCFHSGDGTINSWVTHQFSVRKGRMRLIGQETAEESGPRSQPDSMYTDSYMSTNYLTGSVIETKKFSGRVVSRTNTSLSPRLRVPVFLEDADL